MPYAILTVILVALDQLVKYLVLENIALGEHIPFIPYILDLTYVQNTGAAFSMFEEHTWMLTLISAVMSVVLAVAIWKNFFRHPLGKLCLTLILGGAIGNLIDRAFRGFVVVGGFGAALYYLFLVPKLDHPEETHDKTDADR